MFGPAWPRIAPLNGVTAVTRHEAAWGVAWGTVSIRSRDARLRGNRVAGECAYALPQFIPQLATLPTGMQR
jgi:hypothetical protein